VTTILDLALPAQAEAACGAHRGRL
jgi:hypothetical protein